MRELTGAQGRYDAQKVAQSLGLSLRELAELLGRNVSTLSRNPEGLDLQEGLAPLITVLDLLHRTGASDDGVRAWLRSPIPGLGYSMPLELMRSGNTGRVREALERAVNGDLA